MAQPAQVFGTINSNMLDVIIIGGGTAGLSAAIWCRELGLEYFLLENSSRLGGQLGLIHFPITNIPGISSINALDFQSNLVDKLDVSKSVRLVSKIKSVSAEPIAVETDNGEILTAKVLIIATGVRRRELSIPGEQEFIGKGILDSGAKDPKALAGRNVVIVGGGDAALENVSIISPYAAKIYVVHHREKFSARNEFVEKLKTISQVEIITNTVVCRIEGTKTVRAVEIKNLSSGQTQILPTDNVLIRIGVNPNTELFRDKIDLNKHGYVITNSSCETNVSRVFAIGDAANQISPTIATAIGNGATAVKNAISPAETT